LIGEKGVTLSGGQKARLSLARALYYDRDIMLLDDPLSAVDAHVGHFLLQDCMLGYAKKKTRILVTHKIEAAKVADQVLIMRDGEIIETLDSESLKKSDLLAHLSEQFKGGKRSKNEDDDDDDSEDDGSEGGENEDDPDMIPLLKKVSSKVEDEAAVNSSADSQPNEKIISSLVSETNKEITQMGVKSWIKFLQYYGGVSFFSYASLLMGIRNCFAASRLFAFKNWAESNA
jgi:ABC-type proline/glycine betaine transport system ATPase subunit